jgi:GNAT superfamily N-acetyltransferase
MEVAIREARAADASELTRIYAQFGPHDRHVTPQRVIELLGHFAGYPDYHVYVAEASGAIVGTISILIAEALGSRCRPFAVVEDVVVDEACRRAGIGRAMMKFAMDRARQAGCYKLMLSTNVTRLEAHQFYESLGFAKHGYSYSVDLAEARG